ncbi:MAG: alpha/beta fold hydrolase, partial [Ilumatobacter sp.]|uniref:alpha/beta fold hydrolase n=1 Tax=Ilumatobacter sp. TaxID=1967498 RepID=UPI003C746D28
PDVRVLAASMRGAGESGDAAAFTIDELGAATLEPIIGALGSDPRPVTVLGWSIGGVAAYDLGRRLAEHEIPVVSVGLIDTIFPGEHRHIWSNRWWKYKSMLRPGSFGEATREFAVMGRRRVDKLTVRLGRKLLEIGGEPVSGRVVDTTASGVPFGALDDRPVDSAVPVTLYAADTTSRDRTEHPWRTVTPGLRVVPIDGRHRGFQSVMAADRVGAIVDDVIANIVARAVADAAG